MSTIDVRTDKNLRRQRKLSKKKRGADVGRAWLLTDGGRCNLA